MDVVTEDPSVYLVFSDVNRELFYKVETYQRAVSERDNDSNRHYSLAKALHEAGDLRSALKVAHKAVNLSPTNAEYAHLLGIILYDSRQARQAVQQFSTALSLDRQRVDTCFYLGLALYRLGLRDESYSAFKLAHQIDDEFLPAEWALALWLPQVFENAEEISEAKHRWDHGVKFLSRKFADRGSALPNDAVLGPALFTNFFLAYQGHHEVQRYRRYGALLHSVVSKRFPQQSCHSRRRRHKRVRIGFVSAHFRFHSVGKTHGRWVTDLDSEHFESHLFHVTGLDDESGMNEAFRQSSARYVRTTSAGLLVRAIRESAPDILIYLDIGMDARTSIPAALRLAPIQCVAGGHPVTTGFPTLDYFISSELMEPDDAQSHYSEKLVLLPNLGGSFPRPPVKAISEPDSSTPVYLCSQSLYKLLPQYDWIFPEIASRVRNCEFWFFEGSMPGIQGTVQTRLSSAFSSYGLSYNDFVHFLPPMDYLNFLRINQRADIFLDTIGWSGMNTAIEALACGLPIVTLPGRTMRGRHCFALLSRIDVTDTIAKDVDHYCAIAAGLGRDADRRSKLSRLISTRVSRLFDDQAPIDALSEFLLRTCHSGTKA